MCWECGATQNAQWVYTTAEGNPCRRIQTTTTTYCYGDKVLHTYVESTEQAVSRTAGSTLSTASRSLRASSFKPKPCA